MKPAGASVLVLAAAVMAAWATTAQDTEPSKGAQAAQSEPAAPSAASLRFDDERIARVEAMLAGKDRHEYSFDARRGQRIALILSSERASWIGMDLVAAPVFASTHRPAAANSPAVYTNFIDGSTRWEGVVPADGTYTLRVGLLNAQARELDGIDYQLDVNLK
jgi:hypothetical protein